MNPNPRLKDISMGIQEMARLISEGNLDVIQDLCHLAGQNETIDPDDWSGVFGPFIHFDFFGIYGVDIHILHKEICKGSSARTIAVLRAIQLGIVPESSVKKAIANVKADQPCALNPDQIWDCVCKRLPRFQKPQA